MVCPKSESVPKMNEAGACRLIRQRTVIAIGQHFNNLHPHPLEGVLWLRGKNKYQLRPLSDFDVTPIRFVWQLKGRRILLLVLDRVDEPKLTSRCSHMLFAEPCYSASPDCLGRRWFMWSGEKVSDADPRPIRF
jgi:hypothetical protein